MTEVTPTAVESEFILTSRRILATLASLGAAAIWWITGEAPTPALVSAWGETAAAVLSVIAAGLTLTSRVWPKSPEPKLRWKLRA